VSLTLREARTRFNRDRSDTWLRFERSLIGCRRACRCCRKRRYDLDVRWLIWMARLCLRCIISRWCVRVLVTSQSAYACGCWNFFLLVSYSTIIDRLLQSNISTDLWRKRSMIVTLILHLRALQSSEIIFLAVDFPALDKRISRWSLQKISSIKRNDSTWKTYLSNSFLNSVLSVSTRCEKRSVTSTSSFSASWWSWRWGLVGNLRSDRNMLNRTARGRWYRT
jgi:hypothetical protein